MKKFWFAIKPSIIFFLVFTVICGIIYPASVTIVAQVFFNHKANGSIITIDEKAYGSELIAQEFTQPKYLIGRPRGVTNLAPKSDELKVLIEKRKDFWQKIDPQNTKEIPQDLITSSASGVDPNISLKAAEYQVERIAKARGISEEKVREIIEQNTTKPFLSLFGEPCVNVLKVNIVLDNLM